MKEVILEIAGLGNTDVRYERQMRVYEKRARKARAEAFARVFGGLGRGIAAGVRELLIRIRRRRLEKAAIRELSALDDRLLKDIGLGRSDIGAVASTLAARDADKHRRAIETSRHARSERKVASATAHADRRAAGRNWRRAA